MAHNLNFKNGKASMMYFGEKPWHGLGTELKHAATAEEALEAAQLNFVVKKAKMYAKIDGDYVENPLAFSTYRTDTGGILGTVGARYTPVQNTDAFRFFDSLVGEGEAMYHTAGALGAGETIWILAKLPDYIKVGGKDIVEKFLLLYNTHDGSSVIRARLTPVRVVCNNTLTAALRDSREQEVRIRHTANAVERLEQAHKVLGLTNQVYEELGKVFNRMSDVKTTKDERKEYTEKLFPVIDEKNEEHVVHQVQKREKVLQLEEAGVGAELSRGTVWGIYNAATEYADHIWPNDSNRDKHLKSIWFGDRGSLKKQAFELANQLISRN
ncbi:MAG: DUF945 domain-containing protein [Bacteroidetes bacterium]|nr:DUF945 domain-containing protein [Bacteroidota bacterium]